LREWKRPEVISDEEAKRIINDKQKRTK